MTVSSTYPSPNALSPPTVSNVSISVTTSNPQRVGLYVFNTSATVVSQVFTPCVPASAVNAWSYVQ